MKKPSLVQLLALALALALALGRSGAAAYAFIPPGVPTALPSQVVVVGAARFTVLTKYLIRLVSP